MNPLPSGAKILAANDNASSRALEIGKAGEHLVCADLIMQGYKAFLSDQGLPYDVLVDTGRILRIQVKSTLQAKNVSSAGRLPRVAYSWGVRRRGRDGSKRLDESSCDIVALVALDIRVVAYFPIAAVGQTVQLLPPGEKTSAKPCGRGWSGGVDAFPFERAVSGKIDFSSLTRKVMHCPQGHEYTPENTRQKINGIGCRECERIYARARLERIRHAA